MSGADSASIAVVIPAHDAEGFIREALDSVWIQTRRPDECVVIDDGSRDGTAARVTEWIERHDLPVRLISQENRGAAAARSAGVQAATSDLVAFLDADDVLQADALAILEGGFETWPDLAACFGNAERWLVDGTAGSDYLSGKPVWRLPFESVTRPAPAGDETELRRIEGGLFESLLGGSYIANCAALVRRDAAIEAGLWSDEFPTVEDRDFWLRLSRVGPFAYSPRLVAQVRYHDHNLTATRGSAQHAADGARVLQKMTRLADSLDLDERERAALRKALGHAIEGALYAASLEGPAAYRRTVRALAAAGEPVRWARPKNILRALLAGLTRAKRPPPAPHRPA